MRYLLILTIFCTITLSGCKSNKEISETSCMLVTEHLQENSKIYDGFFTEDIESISCIAVELDKPLKYNLYNHAVAYLNNGSELEIIVEIKNDSVYVKLKNEPLLRLIRYLKNNTYAIE